MAYESIQSYATSYVNGLSLSDLTLWERQAFIAHFQFGAAGFGGWSDALNLIECVECAVISARAMATPATVAAVA